MMAHLLITLLLALLLSVHCQPQQPPSLGSRAGPTQQFTSRAKDFLDVHNKARVDVGVGPLRWSPMLANATAHLTLYQRVKYNCQFADLSSAKTTYGANQLWARGPGVGPRDVVGAWVAEKQYYNHVTNTCIGNHPCGVYKQVVWRKSVEVGCAQASCAKYKSSLTVCFYNPPGNIVGQSPY